MIQQIPNLNLNLSNSSQNGNLLNGLSLMHTSHPSKSSASSVKSNSSSVSSSSDSSLLSNGKRSRTTKKIVPDQSKDIKYFERRKRNNVAAKKSRDARKQREDEIAIRASFLEKENAILKAQLQTLKDEAQQLRILLAQKKTNINNSGCNNCTANNNNNNCSSTGGGGNNNNNNSNSIISQNYKNPSLNNNNSNTNRLYSSTSFDNSEQLNAKLAAYQHHL
jgi:hypothetical protein